MGSHQGMLQFASNILANLFFINTVNNDYYLALRWLAIFSSDFQRLYFGGSVLPLFVG